MSWSAGAVGLFVDVGVAVAGSYFDIDRVVILIAPSLAPAILWTHGTIIQLLLSA